MQVFSMDWHGQSITQVKQHFQVTRSGLITAKITARRKKFGKNSLPQSHERVTRIKIFLDQWKSPLIIILLVAGAISGLLGEFIDMTIILITAGINGAVGFFQEDKANKALSRLQHMIKYHAIVIRNSKKKKISGEDLVPGDLMLLEAGDKIQADARIIELKGFEVKEAALTGESEPIQKHCRKINVDAALGDRKNMVFRGSVVVNGSATVIVTETGASTQIGQIATLVKETKEEKTPLQIQLSDLGKLIGIIIVTIAFGIFILGTLIRSGVYDTLELFETAVAVSVAAIPEGLVISLSVILAIGMQHILKRKALVRKLVAAETLGSVSVICTDKTGTLTEGNMTLTRVITSTEEVTSETKKVSADVRAILRTSIFCNNASIEKSKAGKKLFLGDSTETALVKGALKFGVNKNTLDKQILRIDEVPFDSKKKFMLTLQKEKAYNVIHAKGAPEVLFKKCSHYLKNEKIYKLDAKQLSYYKKELQRLTKDGLRVLAVAYKEVDKNKKSLIEKDGNGLILAGLVAITDPIRSDVHETIEIAHQAGIHVVMITGDHVATAEAIARQAGITVEKGGTMTGKEIENLDLNNLKQKVGNISVFARVEPRHKVMIVKAFQELGEVVAMTGDGVNDAPALKGADIGVALGSGTDVAKEIADIVLLDDKFSTIVAAVEEGRTVYQNIKKVVLYLLAGSFAEVILISGSLILGLPLAVLPAQILWVNIIEDSFPNMALAFDPAEKENMKAKPRKKKEGIVDGEMKAMIAIISIVSNIVLFSLFFYYLKVTGDLARTRTVVFLGLAIDSLLYIYSVRSMRYHIWEINPFNNKYLNLAVLFGWAMLIFAIYWHPLQILLQTVPISLNDWGVVIAFGFVNIFLIEFVKTIYLFRTRKTA